ncbi:FAD-dependent monooxygenase [Streptomyces sp. AV19]|uniref:FAD-dependent monooxygenase n=1 Tax=Streptomyces sp. AV19 TaxID=2793068 RepID=UPI0018FE9083|nr:FAD-dependent monooxygenase [Streptomyces sp. AV19]MBH1933934.1 FAD-dependent monooxygenase [Streptomyces sp. AV19]MDG4535586.1 FAD-dependent monooxygenase [Streptomyces sp. AV19]
MNTDVTHTDVLIVGAGPTGLTLACTLARAGAGVRVIDKSPEFHRSSRAKGPNQRSREILADLGLGPALDAAGSPRFVLRKYRGGIPLHDVDINAGARVTPEVPYPTGLAIPQWRTEEILRDGLAAHGVHVERGCELAELEQGEDSATVTLADGRRIAASYVVGCDGGHSAVRAALGVAFPGETRKDQVGWVADVEADGLDRDYWHQWFDEDGALLLWPVPGTTSWQLQSSVERDAEGHVAPPSLDAFQRLFDRHARVPGVRLANPTWLSTYRVNTRMAERFRAGRVFLAGDAAHVHPVAGGLGMNTGIQDAFNLGWKLALVVRRRAGEALLDSYDEERRPVAAWTLEFTGDRLRAAMEGTRRPGVGTEVVITEDGTTLGVRYPWSSLAWGGPKAGERAPDGRARDRRRLHEVFAGPHFTLLGFGEGSGKALAEAGEKCPELLRTCAADDASRAAYGIGDEDDALVLVRPDHHIALSTRADRGAEAVDRLLRLGR